MHLLEQNIVKRIIFLFFINLLEGVVLKNVIIYLIRYCPTYTCIHHLFTTFYLYDPKCVVLDKSFHKENILFVLIFFLGVLKKRKGKSENTIDSYKSIANECLPEGEG